MSSIIQTIQQRKTTNHSLPVSSPSEDQTTVRRRLSSLSLPIPSISASPATSSKSLSSMGENAKKWWDLGWSWILSRKPVFVQDLEMNQQEKHFIGLQNRGTLRHLLFKFKSEVKKLLRYHDLSLPQTYNNNQSFHGGMRRASTIG